MRDLRTTLKSRRGGLWLDLALEPHSQVGRDAGALETRGVVVLLVEEVLDPRGERPAARELDAGRQIQRRIAAQVGALEGLRIEVLAATDVDRAQAHAGRVHRPHLDA